MWEAFARHYAERPEEYREMVALGERLEALANEPAGSPAVENLAKEMAGFYEEHPVPPETSGQPGWSEGPLGVAMGNLLTAELSPAQKRCVGLAGELLEKARGGGRGDGWEA